MVGDVKVVAGNVCNVDVCGADGVEGVAMLVCGEINVLGKTELVQGVQEFFCWFGGGIIEVEVEVAEQED